ncbi:hypothetical protein [Methanobacterium ferruginis]|uniref:hypothetical protein n=1 Tax=Methanobacterium ferruginis TaxID=710191 RepID=UPI0025748D64|nr:hypothetical protein [Methanobacterium ferruginis]BDZ68649.1 hypothetical protein GCM10025860_20970 [Methanobacterium ferruginis]
MEHESEDERWIWLSFAPEHRLILAAYAGAMTQDAADEIVKQTCMRIDEENLPLFVTDGRKYYKQALLDKYSYIAKFPRTGRRGRPRKTMQMPAPKLKYAQVVKEREGGAIVNIEKRIIFGTFDDINDTNISTSHIERENLTLRQDNNRLTRKTLGYSKTDEWLQYHATLQMTEHNFVRTHDSLKKPYKKQIKGKVWRKYKNQTPMMSVGITDHIWTLKELLTFPYHKNINT